jgi:hypothetical protein
MAHFGFWVRANEPYEPSAPPGRPPYFSAVAGIGTWLGLFR